MPSSNSLVLHYTNEDDQYHEVLNILSIYNIVFEYAKTKLPKLAHLQETFAKSVTYPFLAVGNQSYSPEELRELHLQNRISSIKEFIAPPENYTLLKNQSISALIEDILDHFETLEFAEESFTTTPKKVKKPLTLNYWSQPIQKAAVRTSPPPSHHPENPLEKIPIKSANGAPALTQVGDQYFYLSELSTKELEAGLTCLLNHLCPGLDKPVENRCNILVKQIGFSEGLIQCIIGVQESKCTL